MQRLLSVCCPPPQRFIRNRLAPPADCRNILCVSVYKMGTAWIWRLLPFLGAVFIHSVYSYKLHFKHIWILSVKIHLSQSNWTSWLCSPLHTPPLCLLHLSSSSPSCRGGVLPHLCSPNNVSEKLLGVEVKCFDLRRKKFSSKYFIWRKIGCVVALQKFQTWRSQKAWIRDA